MHVPDGFLNAPTSVATGVFAIATVGVALKRSRAELDERTAPMAGLVAAFVFAVQMLNFPVGVGTSGHLMGGALAAVLVGPWTAVIVLSVVLLVQALLFADGGLTALGTNITLIGIVTVAVGWFVAKLLLTVLPKRPASVVPAAFVGALLSVPAAAAVFVVLYLIGGAVELPFNALLATMLGWHTLIGIGEALITGATVGAVIAVRPDLVYAARGLRPELELKNASGDVIGTTGSADPEPSAQRPVGAAVVGALLVSFVLAGVVSFFASSNPDGLEFVAEDQGFLDSAKDSAVGEFLLADYGEVGGIPVGIAGIIGVVVTLLIGWGIGRWVARRRAPESDATLERV